MAVLFFFFFFFNDDDFNPVLLAGGAITAAGRCDAGRWRRSGGGANACLCAGNEGGAACRLRAGVAVEREGCDRSSMMKG